MTQKTNPKINFDSIKETDLVGNWFEQDQEYNDVRESIYQNYKQIFKNSFVNNNNTQFFMTYTNFINFITKNAVVATIIMILAVGGASTAAAQFFAPEEYKPSNILFPKEIDKPVKRTFSVRNLPNFSFDHPSDWSIEVKENMGLGASEFDGFITISKQNYVIRYDITNVYARGINGDSMWCTNNESLVSSQDDWYVLNNFPTDSPSTFVTGEKLLQNVEMKYDNFTDMNGWTNLIVDMTKTGEPILTNTFKYCSMGFNTSPFTTITLNQSPNSSLLYQEAMEIITSTTFESDRTEPQPPSEGNTKNCYEESYKFGINVGDTWTCTPGENQIEVTKANVILFFKDVPVQNENLSSPVLIGETTTFGKLYGYKSIVLGAGTPNDECGTVILGENASSNGIRVMIKQFILACQPLNIEDTFASISKQEIIDIINSFEINTDNTTNPNLTNTLKAYTNPRYPNLSIPYDPSWSIKVDQTNIFDNVQNGQKMDIKSTVVTLKKDGLELTYTIMDQPAGVGSTGPLCTNNEDLFLEIGNGIFKTRNANDVRNYLNSGVTLNSKPNYYGANTTDLPSSSGNPATEWVSFPNPNQTFKICRADMFIRIVSTNQDTSSEYRNQAIVSVSLKGVTSNNIKLMTEADQIVATTKF